jgi:hypothetical protein
MDYEELRAQSFEYYCLALEKYNPLKASFSTYLYTYVSGKLLLYCQQKRRYEGQDCLISEEESYEDFIASLKACENPSTEQFMAYANCFLTPTAHNILKWVVYEGITFIRSKDNRQLTVKALSKRFNVNAQIIQSAWKELFDFWNMKGAAFYASN